MTLLKHDNATLQMLSKDRQKIEKEIAAADAYAKNVTQNAEQWASLSEAQTLSGAKKVTAQSLITGLGDALHMIKAFSGAIRKLAKEGPEQDPARTRSSRWAPARTAWRTRGRWRRRRRRS